MQGSHIGERMTRLFGTDGMRGLVNNYPMTADMALRLGLAAGMYFRGGKHKHKVIIGKDTRLSGYLFESALTAGLCAMGMDVYQVGPMPTPAIAFLTRNMRADLGVVISASHNPFCDNGIKFFDKDGFKLPDETEDIISQMVVHMDQEWDYPPSHEVGRTRKIFDAPGRYIVYIKNSFPQELSLSGVRVVLDCANGANYKIAPLALEELGAEVFPLSVSPNGTNINDQCGSLHPDKMQAKVCEVRADIGLALDGDADRLIVADENGRVLDGDEIMAICAKDLLTKGKLHNNMLIATVMSNMGLDDFMTTLGGSLLRTDVGDRHVVGAMRKWNANFGGEKSGHLIFRDFSTTGDGLLAALQLLRIMQETGKKLSELAGQLSLYAQEEHSVAVSHKPSLRSIPEIQDAIASAENELGSRGRVLLRYSGTENVCRIMVEARNEKLVKRISAELVDIVTEKLANSEK